MKKLKFRKWVKYVIVATFIIASIIIITHFICNNLEKIEKEAKNCDRENGHMCSLYEVKNYMSRGN